MQSEALRMHDLFTGLHRAYGIFNIKKVNAAKNNKMEGYAQTLQKPVTPLLWQSHLVGTSGLGIIPIRDDATCCFGAIDIDINDIDHVALERKINDLDLPLVVCRSKSGGAHCYLFLLEPVSGIVVRSTLLHWSTLLGHPGCEVFPKQTKLANDRDVGNFINMPYFDVPNTVRYAVIHGKQASINTFIEYAYDRCVTREDLEATKSKIVQSNEFSDGPPCLEALAKEKCDQGGRNEGLFNFGVYAKLKYPDDWENKVQDWSQSYMEPPLAYNETATVIKQLNKKEYFYTCTRPPICTKCNKELCKLREFGIGQGEAEIDVILDCLTKIDTSPPTWFVTVDGVRIECLTDDLRTQHKFAKVCMEKINKLPATVKTRKWEKKVRELLQNIEVIEAPEDAGAEGQFNIHLENFCMGRAPARNKDELLMGKVWFEDGYLHFRSVDLFKYLDQQHFREFNQAKIWSIMQENFNAKKDEYRVKGRHIRTWRIPEFSDIQDDEFDRPRLDSEF